MIDLRKNNQSTQLSKNERIYLMGREHTPRNLELAKAYDKAMAQSEAPDMSHLRVIQHNVQPLNN